MLTTALWGLWCRYGRIFKVHLFMCSAWNCMGVGRNWTEVLAALSQGNENCIPCTNWRGSSVHPRSDLDALEKQWNAFHCQETKYSPSLRCYVTFRILRNDVSNSLNTSVDQELKTVYTACITNYVGMFLLCNFWECDRKLLADRSRWHKSCDVSHSALESVMNIMALQWGLISV